MNRSAGAALITVFLGAGFVAAVIFAGLAADPEARVAFIGLAMALAAALTPSPLTKMGSQPVTVENPPSQPVPVEQAGAAPAPTRSGLDDIGLPAPEASPSSDPPPPAE